MWQIKGHLIIIHKVKYFTKQCILFHNRKWLDIDAVDKNNF